jgi:murein DD-endopeptidase MepM/ murein hydrolase activator NlpD
MRILLAATLLLGFTGNAQFFSKPDYPAGYFRNPLNIPIQLSGNFGELRPNHYHMGLDLKTQKKENLPVFAAADGYIARIKIEPAGFGRAIYINHPNGFTTLYAHLNNFNPRLEAWLKEQQYSLQSWGVFLELTPDLFPVKKCELLAYSGNTGGSQAPHLHFEIRQTNGDINLNPILFGLPIPDNVKPTILRLAVYDRTRSVYEQSPRIFPVKKSAADYVTTPAVITVNSPKISFAITSYDTHTGSSNLNGIFESVLYIDGRPVSGFQMNKISYNDTRYLNAHIDYRVKSAGGAYLQHLSDLPGYLNSVYQGDGVILLQDGETRTVDIETLDGNGNTSKLSFKIRYQEPAVRNIQAVNGKMFYPLMLDGFESPDCEFFIGEKCLYDSVHIRYASAVSANPSAVSGVHSIGTSYIPLQEPYLIRIKPNRVLTPQEQSRTVMQWYAGARSDVQKVEWQQQWAGGRFRDFGSYQLIVDEVPPVIVPVGFTNGSDLRKSSRLVFTVKDNMGRFKNVKTELDGKWLRFTNDKGRTFIYIFDEKCPPGTHELKISTEDEAGNTTSNIYRFTR